MEFGNTSTGLWPRDMLLIASRQKMEEANSSAQSVMKCHTIRRHIPECSHFYNTYREDFISAGQSTFEVKSILCTQDWAELALLNDYSHKHRMWQEHILRCSALARRRRWRETREVFLDVIFAYYSLTSSLLHLNIVLWIWIQIYAIYSYCYYVRIK
jgi:hypothetical protein